MNKLAADLVGTRLNAHWIAVHFVMLTQGTDVLFMYKMYRVRRNTVAPSIFCGFLSNRLEFQRKILHTYLVIICAFNSRISI